MTEAAIVAVPAYRAFETTVVATVRLSPTFLRVTLGGADLDLFGPTGLDQRIKLVLPLAGGDPYGSFPRDVDWYAAWRALPEGRRNPLRTFTVRRVRPEAREVDVDIALHGDLGPASRWAAAARPGDPLVVIGPDVRGDSARVGVEWEPGVARQVLLVGDETAVPAVSGILEQASRALRGVALLEVPCREDVLPLDAPPGVAVRWLPRDGRPRGEAVLEALASATRQALPAACLTGFALDLSLPGSGAPDEMPWEIATPAGERYAWIAGEAGMVRATRRLLVSAGWPKSDVSFMGYWRLGASET